MRYLLLPFSWLYGLGIWVRHVLYDHDIRRSTRFQMPIIVVGNLAVGGAGKSPMTEYLIELLSPRYKIATLSRGYGRETHGFRQVSTASQAFEVGDEPLQFKTKFPDITVAVCENRVEGITKLMKEHDVIVLDDAFQHRALVPGLSILLFDYRSLKEPIFLLPAGNFRDLFSRRKRADGMVVTKAPRRMDTAEQAQIIRRLKPSDEQWMLFSHLAYGEPYPLNGSKEGEELEDATDVLLLTGIANPEPLKQELLDRKKRLEVMAFPDHHMFSISDLRDVVDRFNRIPTDKKIVLTTEKDAQRLKAQALRPFLEKIPCWVLPVRMAFKAEDDAFFQKKIIDYCEENRKH